MLELIPKMEDSSIQDFEEFLERVRVKRLAQLVEYQSIQLQELSQQSSKVATRLHKQHEMLGKELMRLAELVEKCDKRINTISQLRDELDLIDELKGGLEE